MAKKSGKSSSGSGKAPAEGAGSAQPAQPASNAAPPTRGTPRASVPRRPNVARGEGAVGSQAQNFPPPPPTAQAAAAGRRIILFQSGAADAGVKLLRDKAGLRMASTADAKTGALSAAEVREAGGVYLHKLGVAVVAGETNQFRMAAAAASGGEVASVSPVRVVYALANWYRRASAGVGAGGGSGVASQSGDYLRGYRDGVVSMVDRVGAAPAPVAEARVSAGTLAGDAFADDDQATWGLNATGVLTTRFSGAGVRVAVLDTGVAPNHPDLAGRHPPEQVKSFVPDVGSVNDGNGHGTHCIGTSCGTMQPTQAVPRYGVAHGAQLYVGKVLHDEGWGLDEWFVQALNWAVNNQVRVVSFSIGGEPGATHDRTFELIARRVLDAGTLIVAAAGNESARSRGRVRPVDHPADCPSIMSVAALQPDLSVADFSNRGVRSDGGQIDIAAPGVDVFSSGPPDGYFYESGTSMATPHVAGIAAMYFEARPDLNARGIWSILMQEAQRLETPSSDVGAGLVRAPT